MGNHSYAAQTVSRDQPSQRRREHRGAKARGEGNRVRGTRGAVGQAWGVAGGMQRAAGTSMVRFGYEFGGPQVGAQRAAMWRGAAGKGAAGRRLRQGGPQAGEQQVAAWTRRGCAWGILGTRWACVDDASRERRGKSGVWLTRA